MSATARPVRAPTGRPLLALAGLVTCWICARIAVWELPAPLAGVERSPPWLLGQSATPRRLAARRIAPPAPEGGVALARVALAKISSARAHAPDEGSSLPAAAPHLFSLSKELARGRAPHPVVSAPALPNSAVVPRAKSAQQTSAGRWSADLWLALREGGSALFGGGSTAPVYGASQAGAVVRYRLAPASQRDVAVYARVVHALDRREGDVAAGLAARIAPGIPVTAHVEARVSRRDERVDLRPAAFVTTGFDEAHLPMQFRARGYAQAGYVGGRDATAFADGFLAAERRLTRDEDPELLVGAGLWGGAQRGASRLDLGPSASLRFPLGEGSARLAIDYRVRVAGNAVPASGAALTLSAGF